MPKTDRTRAVATLSVAVALATALLGWTGSVLAESHDIAIVDFEFQPPSLTVFVGEPVTWTNNAGRDHTVTSDEGTELDSGTIGAGEAYGHAFEKPGTFAYHCAIHPGQMKGTIVVKAAPATPTPSGKPTPTPPSGTLPPDFSPNPSVGPPDSPTPQASAAPSPSPSPSPTPTPEPGAASGSSLPLVVGFGLAIVVGAGIAFLLARGRPTKQR